MSITEELKRFILEELVEEGGPTSLSDDDPLIEQGLIDSMAAMQIIAFIEEETGLRVPDREVAVENFESVTAMQNLVDRLSGKAKGIAE